RLCRAPPDGAGHQPLRREGAEHHRDENAEGDARLGETALRRAREQAFLSGVGEVHYGVADRARIVEVRGVIPAVREMLGATSGLKALAGTIRGDYSSSRQMNLV